jgi:hypothetical protein
MLYPDLCAAPVCAAVRRARMNASARANASATSLLGARVEASSGPREGEQGEVLRRYSHNVVECYWDDGTIDRYQTNDLARVELLPPA